MQAKHPERRLPPTVFVRVRGTHYTRDYQIWPKDILYIESLSDYVRIFVLDHPTKSIVAYVVHFSLTEICHQLEPYGIVRVNRGHGVNRNHVHFIEENVIQLQAYGYTEARITIDIGKGFVEEFFSTVTFLEKSKKHEN